MVKDQWMKSIPYDSIEGQKLLHLCTNEVNQNMVHTKTIKKSIPHAIQGGSVWGFGIMDSSFFHHDIDS